MNIFNIIRHKFHPFFYLSKFSFFKKFLKKKIIFLKNSKKYGKFYLYLPSHISFYLDDQNIEKNTYQDLLKLTKEKKLKNKVFVDIGANIGTYSFFFKKKFNSKVFLFEPDLDNLILLFKSKKLNRFKNFEIFPFAISNSIKNQNFLIDDIFGATGTLSSKRNVPQLRMGLKQKVNILTVKLDILIDLIPKIDWIKIDIEGHEYEALKGMKKIIKRDVPNFIIETDTFNLKKINNLLRPWQYKFKKIENEPNYIFYK